MKRAIIKILIGIVATIIGAILQWILWPWVGPGPFIIFYPVIIVSSNYGGLYAGIAATVTSTILGPYIFFPPAFSISGKQSLEPLPFVVFFVSGIFFSVLISKMKLRTIELATEKALRNADQERSRFLENMIIGFNHCEMLFDELGRPVDFIYRNVNSAFETLTGLQNVVGKKASEVIPKLRTSNPELFELCARVAKGGPPETIKTFIPELNNWFSIKVFFPEEKNHFAAVFDIITNEKMAEEALRESEERFRFMIEQSPLSIQILDMSGKTIKISKSFEKLWGLSIDDLKDYNILQDQQLERLGLMPYLKKSFVSGELVELPLREYDATDSLARGFKRLISSTAYPVKDYRGSVRNVILIHEDVTEREKAKAAIIEAKEAAENTSRLKSRFLDIAAHELRTPVTSFSLIVQLGQKQLAKGHPVEASTLDRLRLHADRISRLVVDLLDVSRLERNELKLQLENKDIVFLIALYLEDYKLLRPERTFIFLKPKGPIELKFDPVRILQVVTNLLDNACRYTAADIPIEISIETMPGFVRFSVKDKGQGISDEQQKTLFTPFTRGSVELTGSSGGLGLGLYISRMIVELHKGRIGVISKLGSGSTFYFELPTSLGDQKI